MLKSIKQFGIVKSNLAWQSPPKFYVTLNIVLKKSFKYTSANVTMFFLFLFYALAANANTSYASTKLGMTLDRLHAEDPIKTPIDSGYSITFTKSDIEPTSGTYFSTLEYDDATKSYKTVWYEYVVTPKTDAEHMALRQTTRITADMGGADLVKYFVGLNVNVSEVAVKGGAIYSDNGQIGNITGDFIGNSAQGFAATGGAIHNANSSTISDITGDFIGNYTIGVTDTMLLTRSEGGAIYNQGKIGNITGNFIGNSAQKGISIYAGTNSSGGAIYNQGTIGDITGNFIGNYIQGEGYTVGGAIYNNGTIDNITGDFIGNYAQDIFSAKGGAIYNDKAIDNITGDFIRNYAHSQGGAIYNNGTIANITGDFIDNYAQFSSSAVNGGAIYNNSTMGGITGNFIDNYAQSSSSAANGGAIYNNSTMGGITGNFIDNYAQSPSSPAYGGAIYNKYRMGNITGNFIGNHVQGSYGGGGAIANYNTIGDITGDFIGNYAQGGDSVISGGAIYSDRGTIGNITGNFIGNYVRGNSYTLAFGGAISNNSGAIGEITGDFTGNIAQSKNLTSYGGAIVNGGTIDNITGNFIGNIAQSEKSSANGGAIDNMYGSTIGNITGDFIGNIAQSENSTSYGGAIVSSGTMTLSTKDKDQFLSGNYTISNGVDKVFNAVYLDSSAKLNLNSASGLNLVFNDGITSYNTDNKINLTGDGNVIFNDTIEDVSIDLQKGALILGRENKYTTSDCVDANGGCRNIDVSAGSLFSNVNLDMKANTTLDTTNNVIQTTNINNFTLANDAQFAIDIDLSNSTADNFNITTLDPSTSAPSVKLKNVSFIGSTGTSLTDILVFNKNITISNLDAYYGGKEYKITDSGSNGKINIAVDASKIWNLTDVIEAPASTTRQYIMAENEIIASHLGVQKDTEVEIMGNKKSIIGNADGTKKDGAIVSAGQTLALNDVASVKGFNATNGAINTTGKVEIIANSTNTTFSDNDGVDIVVNDVGEVVLKADTSKTITVTNGIAGNGSITKDGVGKLLIEKLATTDDFTGKFDLMSGTVALSADANDFFANAGSLNVYGCMLDLANGSILGTSLGALTLNNNLELGIDVDLLAKTSDSVSLASLSNNGNFNIAIDKINILEDAGEESVSVNVSTNTDIVPILKLNAKEVNGKIFKYRVSDEELDSLGNLIFNKAGGLSSTDYNPALFAGVIATQGAMLNAQYKNTATVFENLDSCNDLSCKPKQFYANSYYEDKDIDFENFSDVEARTYGLIAGVNSNSVYYDKTDIQAVYGLYVASNNGEYKWDNNKLKQNGLNLGVNAMYDYKNAFLGLSTGVGANKFELNSEDFYGYSANVASKIGYNINLTDAIILTPAIKTSYIYMNVDDYKTKAGANVATSDAHAWQISPEIKLQTILNDGYKGYIKTAYVENIVSGGKASADNITLPNLETKSYVEYSMGVEKDLNEKWSGYVNASMQTGGQDGYGFNAGLKYIF